MVMLIVSLYEKVITFSNVSLLSFESLGQLVKTECMLNLVIECEACLTFNGNNLHEYILGHTHPCSFSFCVKEECH